MISSLSIINAKGEMIITRTYRADLSLASLDAFRKKIISQKQYTNLPPIQVFNGYTYIYIKHTCPPPSSTLFFVVQTSSNLNPSLALEFLYQCKIILASYLGKNFNEDSIRSEMTLIYELFDEILDYGYPQNSSVDVLKLYINLGSALTNEQIRAQAATPSSQLTSQITGAIDWRREGLRYKKNEVYIDVMESVSLLLSTTGQILRNEVVGSVMMNTKLSGMPECKFGLNDKIVIENESSSKSAAAAAGSGSGGGEKDSKDKKKQDGIDIADCTFHRCVRLGKFDADRTITFIPPDGSFELMKYRVTDNILLPFKIIPAISEDSNTRVSVNLKIVANFSDKLSATSLVIKIPVPENTATCELKTSVGKAKYEPSQGCIIYRMKKFQGGGSASLQGIVTLMPRSGGTNTDPTGEEGSGGNAKSKAWSRPPIEVDFTVPMFTSSGVHVRFLRVFDKSGYHTNRWVRYVTKSGGYSVRI